MSVSPNDLLVSADDDTSPLRLLPAGPASRRGPSCQLLPSPPPGSVPTLGSATSALVLPVREAEPRDVRGRGLLLLLLLLLLRLLLLRWRWRWRRRRRAGQSWGAGPVLYKRTT